MTVKLMTPASPSSTRKLYCCIFLIALAARLVFLLYIDEHALFMKYPYFAAKLASGQNIGERLLDLSPFYLSFVKYMKVLFNVNWTSVQLVQSFVGVVNSLLVFALGRRVFSDAVGFFAALMYAIYGNLIALESTLEPEVFVLCFNLTAVYFLVDVAFLSGGLARSAKSSLLAGFFSGISILTKPNFLLFLPFGAIWLVWFATQGASLHQRVVQAGLFVCVAMMVVLPITLRNYLLFRDVVLVTADGGKVFFHGNGNGATALEGTGLPEEGFSEEGATEPDYAHVLFRKKASELSGRNLLPSESSKFWAKQAMNQISSEPMSYLGLELKKLFYFFNGYEMHHIASAYKEYKASLAFPFLTFSIISPLALVGLWLAAADGRKCFTIYAALCVYAASCLLFLVQSRYRMPAVPYLCLFAAKTFCDFCNAWAAKRWKWVIAVFGALVILYLSTNVLWQCEVVKVDRWQIATKVHYELGASPLFKQHRYKDAIAEADRCVAMVPSFSPGYNLRGKCHAILGDYDKAMADFQRVIFLSPRMPDGYRNIGLLFLLKGNAGAANLYLRKALSLNPNDKKAKDALAKG